MLLFLPPGVGQTLTAESVTETMQVPLYMRSAGDRGTDPPGNVVQLLDEADVFLEAHGTYDLERNKLVSIFARSLEYYEGILFLITTSVDSIDAAFESQVHLSFQYDELDVVSRHHVLSTFLKSSTDVGKFTAEELDKLASFSLNGRQIKNVLKIAQLLVSKQEVELR
ncbi:hypothetical protein K432DRAFT_430974 [Lepidopterella palustris CBS 459.81]|uniref:ATPase AAA-type core domain-containing protein n=1 Tax=Lepidopterella palustris CBS 459.81 TaxID=1314670 RepID=A0A8E2JL45_9PEZI|nr:hypothetical protein K432DRAFT_430974 [Lepidopterella palustris CBS 459.81]